MQKFSDKNERRDYDIMTAVRDATELVVSHAKQHKLRTGKPLYERNSRLISSVKTDRVRKAGNTFRGGVGTNVFYGRVLEFGAQTPGHIALRPPEKPAIQCGSTSPVAILSWASR